MKRNLFLLLCTILCVSCENQQSRATLNQNNTSTTAKDYNFISTANKKAENADFIVKELPFAFYFGMTKAAARKKADSLVAKNIFAKKPIPIKDVFHNELYTKTSYSLIQSETNVPILMSFENDSLKMFGYHFVNKIGMNTAKQALERAVEDRFGEADYIRDAGVLGSLISYWYKDNLRITFGKELLLDALVYYNFHNTYRSNTDFLEFTQEEISDYTKVYYENLAKEEAASENK